MSKIRLFPGLILAAVLLAACAPASSTVSPVQATVTPGPTALAAVETVIPSEMAPTEALAPTPVPAATSRGPELHATDPTTVSLASGGLQLVEFFRFT